MINAAMIGLGRWGKNIVNAVQGKSQRLRFVRGVVRHPDAVASFAAQHDLELSSDFAAAITDPRVQAVVLTTPHSLHAEQIIAVARVGKPVFCEKPLALTRADAQRAVDACSRAGVLLGVGHDKRFWPSMRELKRVVASGELGPLQHVEGNFSNETARQFTTAWRESPDESPGGPMTATGIHVLDAFINLVGPARRVTAQLTQTKPPPDLFETISVMLEFERGVSGVLCSIRTTSLYTRVHVFGAKGSAEALGQNELVLYQPGTEPKRMTFEPVDSLRAEMEAFADAIEGRAAYPIPTDQIIATVAGFEAIVRSIETGVAVAV